MVKTIKQVCHLCSPVSYSPILKDSSDLIYSSLDTVDTEEADCEALNAVCVQTDQIEEDEDDHHVKIDTRIYHYRLCRLNIAHDSVLGEIDALLTKKPLAITEAPQLNTKALIAKLDEVPRIVDITCRLF